MAYRPFLIASLIFLAAPLAHAKDTALECVQRYVRQAQLKTGIDHLIPVWPSAGTRAVSSFRLEQAPRIGAAELNLPLKPITDRPGVGYLALYESDLHGQHVFIKVSTFRVNGTTGQVEGLRSAAHREPGVLDREVAWTQRLSDLGVGPKFFGVSRVQMLQSPIPHHAIVTEFVPGFHSQQNHPLQFMPEDFRPTPALIESLKKIREVILREGIRAKDIQLRINSERAVIIDPEFFQPAWNRHALNKRVDYIDELIDEMSKRLPSK